MAGKTVSAREFKEACLSLIDEVSRTHETVTIMDRGKAVAHLVPPQDYEKTTEVSQVVIGGLKGSVLRYDDPFSPAIDPAEWEAAK